jgi:hypothetical protein
VKSSIDLPLLSYRRVPLALVIMVGEYVTPVDIR